MSIELGHFLTALGRLSLEAGVVVTLVLLAQRIFRRQLDPRWRSALWLVVAARLLLPFSFSSGTSIFNVVPHLNPTVAIHPTTAKVLKPAFTIEHARSAPQEVATQTVLSPEISKPLKWQTWVFTGWLAGALFLAGQMWIASLRFSRQCAKLKPCTSRVALDGFAESCDRFKLRTRPALLEGGAIGSPALCGFFRPALFLPEGFADRFSAAEMRFIFLHELAHLKRRDLVFNWVAAALQVVHWFNPLIWLGFARWRADRELACDAMALEIAGAEESRDYGRTVLRVLEMIARPISTPGLVGILEDKRQLRARIDMIANYMPDRKWPRLAMALMAGLAVIGLTDAIPAAAIVGQTQLAQELIGTWVLVGEPGKVGEAPEAGGRYKFFTGSHWVMTEADAKTGVVIFHHGGTYKVKGDEYFESVEYANPSTMKSIGHKGRFKITIVGDTLTDIGEGNPWREVWQRVKTKDDPSQPELRDLVGTWVLTGPSGEMGDGRGLKLITPSGWCDTQSDPDNNIVTIHHGGDFTLKGNRYVETVKYANPVSMRLIGHAFEFDIKLDGDTLHLTGIGNPWNETWKRAK